MAILQVRLAFRHEVWLLEKEGSHMRSWWLHQAAQPKQCDSRVQSCLPPLPLLGSPGSYFSIGLNIFPLNLQKMFPEHSVAIPLLLGSWETRDKTLY